MKVKTYILKGAALDYAVSQIEGVPFSQYASSRLYFAPSKNWSHGGPIIEREKIDVAFYKDECESSVYGTSFVISTGHTPLVAAMRAYVTLKLGDEVEIPSEIMESMK